MISAAALPLWADAPPVYVAAAPFFEREVFVGAQIVNPKLLGPRFLGGGFAVEEPSRWEASETDCVKRRAIARMSGSE